MFPPPPRVQDEAAGGNDQEVDLLRLDGRLLLSTDDLHGYETLPIARIRRAGAEEATPELDDDYIPPLLAIDAWPPLALDIVRAIYDIIGEKIEVLSGRVRERGVTLSSPDPGDLDDLFMLNALNEAQAVLHCLTFARGVHPLAGVYRAVPRRRARCRCSIPQRVVGEIPIYDHDDLARIFKWVKLRIETLLGSRKRLQYEQRYLHRHRARPAGRHRAAMAPFGLGLVRGRQRQEYPGSGRPRAAAAGQARLEDGQQPAGRRDFQARRPWRRRTSSWRRRRGAAGPSGLESTTKSPARATPGKTCWPPKRSRCGSAPS